MLQLVNVDGSADDTYNATYQNLFKVVFKTLGQQNIAQEIKQTAAIAMAKLINVAHTTLNQQQINEVVAIYTERLSGDWTRLSALRALTLIS